MFFDKDFLNKKTLVILTTCVILVLIGLSTKGIYASSTVTVNSYQKISDTDGNFSGILDENDRFGWTMQAIGDLNNDGVEDLAVGVYSDDDGGEDRGAVWILFLNSNRTVKSYQKISDTQGGFDGILNNSDRFGTSLANLGDLKGDGTLALGVGARLDDDGGEDRGAVWILFLNSDGTVDSYQKISTTQGDFGGSLANGEGFGNGLENAGDIDDDGITDLAVGSVCDDNANNQGAVWILFLNSDGTIKDEQEISSSEGEFG